MSSCKRCPLAGMVERLLVDLESANRYGDDMYRDREALKEQVEELKAERDQIAARTYAECAELRKERDAECAELRSAAFTAREEMRTVKAELAETYDQLDNATEQLNAAHEVIRQLQEQREITGGETNIRPGIAWRPGREPGVWVKEAAPEEREKQMRDAGFEM